VSAPVDERERADARPRARRRVGTAAACVVAYLALVLPPHLTPLAFVRLPVEAIALAALVLVLPARPGRVVTAVAGVLIGLLTVLGLLDVGFVTVIGRPFDPVFDWSLLGNAADFVASILGEAGTLAAAVVAVLVGAGLVALVAWSVRRLGRVVVRRRGAAIRVLPVAAAVWVACALLGAQLSPGVPVASCGPACLAVNEVARVRTAISDQQAFAAALGTDAFRDTPADRLLTGLRGKDVLVAYVESYGRDAVTAPDYAPQIDAVLDGGTRDLAAAGYSARSGFLTSPTFGGVSWLAHATFQSGVWANDQQRYDTLLGTDHTSLSSAFKRAGWRTVTLQPGVSIDWPQGEGFYKYDKIYDTRTLGYHGPYFGFGYMPDQYTLDVFQRLERAPGHAPVMGEIPLVSSHVPWAHTPQLVDWTTVGDGSVFDPQLPAGGGPASAVRGDNPATRADYRSTIAYSLSSLISYVKTYGGDNLVLVVLGDHQPPIISATDASRDVPVFVVAHDPAVTARIASWGWTDGLRPAANAPVWPMSAFRDRFLTAFGS
jgi:hypothetical protein